jgi:hypothetical protein
MRVVQRGDVGAQRKFFAIASESQFRRELNLASGKDLIFSISSSHTSVAPYNGATPLCAQKASCCTHIDKALAIPTFSPDALVVVRPQ